MPEYAYRILCIILGMYVRECAEAFLKLVAFANIYDQRKSEMCTCAIKYIPSFGLKIGSGRTG